MILSFRLTCASLGPCVRAARVTRVPPADSTACLVDLAVRTVRMWRRPACHSGRVVTRLATDSIIASVTGSSQ
jgi:hypothetical protein